MSIPEETYLSRDRVLVTSARVVIHGTTYPIRGISAVRAVKILPNRTNAIVLAVFGLAAMYLGFQVLPHWLLYVPGLLALAGGIAWAVIQRSYFAVELATAGMQQQAVVSKDEPFIDEVTAAIARAIVEGK